MIRATIASVIRMLRVLVIGVLVSLPAVAGAQPQLIRGPSDAGDAILASLPHADLAVCWRRAGGASVDVEVAVDARGQVSRATPRSRGPLAQCAAGVLAVQTLHATGKAYTATLRLPTRAPDTARAIETALAAHRPTLLGCREASAREAARAGEVTLRFRVHPDGQITDASVQRSTVKNGPVERCLVKRVEALRIARLTPSPVGFSLTLSFAPGGNDGPADAKDGGPALQPRKVGPLAAAAIDDVMRRRRAEFSACYDRFAARDRRIGDGVVTLRFTVRGDGTVRNVKIRETTLNSAKVESCIVKVGETLRFGAETGRAATKVQYPFAFQRR